MSQGSVVDQIREGMEVTTSDGEKLGKVKQIWYGSETLSSRTPGAEETCFEVQKGLLGREKLYIPCRFVSQVSGQTVQLSADSQTARTTPSWHVKPSWVSE